MLYMPSTKGPLHTDIITENRFCLCIFESDTVKSDCPVQIFRKMMKYLMQTVKKSSGKKKSSEFFFRPPDPKSEKKFPINQPIKKSWP